MKTTVEINDALLEDAKRLAAYEGLSVRTLIEQGLRRIIDERMHADAFRLRKATFKGKGLQSGVADLSWERIREMTYGERGG